MIRIRSGAIEICGTISAKKSIMRKGRHIAHKNTYLINAKLEFCSSLQDKKQFRYIMLEHYNLRYTAGTQLLISNL